MYTANIMVSLSISVGEVLNTLFDDDLYLSDERISDDDDDEEYYIYGYLGERILQCLESRVNFPRKTKLQVDRKVHS